MNLNKKVLPAMCLTAFSGLAFAGTVAVNPNAATALQAGSATSPTPHAIVYTPEAGDQTGNVQGRLIYDAARLTPTLTGGDPVCSNPVPGVIVILTQNNTPTPLAASTLCSVAFASVAAGPLGVTNLDLQFDGAQGDGCFENTMGNPTACTLVDGTVEIIAAPPDVTLSYAPAAGSTITFPGGTALTTSNSSITVTGGGTVGSGTVTSCGITGAGAGAFGAPPADITVAAGATGSLPLSCTLPNSGGAAVATLTCTETDSDTPAPGAARSWTLNCPQGTPVPGPGYSSAPPAGTTLNCDGAPGSATQTAFTVTNNGNPGAGSELTFSCTAAGAGFSIISGGTTTAPGLAVGANQVVTVGCTAAAEGAPANTGTVTCTTNAGTTATYPLSAVGVTVPPPVPRAAIVPAGSTWSYAALIALLAGFGIALVGFRRNH